jgi:L-amino acid N-acyltransferase YncA
VIIRQAKEEDVMQIAEILTEDWKTAYRGIIEDDYLDSLDAAQRYRIEIRRYREMTVAADGDEVLGYAWNETTDEAPADCEIIALYVRYSRRGNGIGRALMRHSMDRFREAGKKTMIVWCLRENHESRKFYEKMGGKADREGTHRWGDREYGMISYLYPLDRQV